MSRTNTYAVPIKTEVLEVYTIVATSAAEAAFIASQGRHEEGTKIEVVDAPTAKVTVTTMILPVRPLVDEGERHGVQLGLDDA